MKNKEPDRNFCNLLHALKFVTAHKDRLAQMLKDFKKPYDGLEEEYRKVCFEEIELKEQIENTKECDRFNGGGG